MRKCVQICFAFSLLMGTATAQAQETEPAPEEACPGSPRTDCDGVCSFDWRPYYEQSVRLMDVKVGQDYQTVRLEDIRPSVETNPVLGTLRETWYVRKESQPGQTGLLYRCKNNTLLDSRDSTSTTEGAPAYNCLDTTGAPNVLANPWIAAAHRDRTPTDYTRSGLLPLRRYKKTGGTDYRTWLTTPPVGYLLDLVLGGTGSGSRLGYQRFGKLLRKSNVLTPGPESGYGVNFLQNNNLRVDFNRTWGNAIGQIRQLGTPRQIVSEPIGDMVQSVLRFDRDPDCRVPNPTQSGGAQCVSPDYSRTTRWAGSPVISETRSGTSAAAPQTFTTVVRPLDFCHNGKNRVTIRDENGVERESTTPPWPGATETDPLLWNGFIERSDTLTCKLNAIDRANTTNMRHEIVRTVSRYQLATNHSGGVTVVEALNTYWLRPKDLIGVATPPGTTQVDFKVICKNLDTGESRPILNVLPGGGVLDEGTAVGGPDDATCGVVPGTIRRARHAIVATRKTGEFAYAVARLDVPPGGITNVSYRCAGVGGCPDASLGTLIIQVKTPSIPLSKGAWSTPQESFLLVGSRSILMDGPANRLDELKAEAVTIRGLDCFN